MPSSSQEEKMTSSELSKWIKERVGGTLRTHLWVIKKKSSPSLLLASAASAISRIRTLSSSGDSSAAPLLLHIDTSAIGPVAVDLRPKATCSSFSLLWVLGKATNLSLPCLESQWEGDSVSGARRVKDPVHPRIEEVASTPLDSPRL
ncbi:unnamed protein product [Linum trigynum]|uniref:Uncharacterized protein n=1 Tax=Linum trigynum TaxID=586398 RepID=A0AAV2C7F2_9ROSI